MEKKIAIAGQGNNDNYKPGEAETFYAAASKLKANYNFAIGQIHNGKQFLAELEKYTKTDGAISMIINFTHGGEFGMALDWDNGFFKELNAYGGKNEATTGDMAKKIESGSIKFTPNAVWIFASCNANRTSMGDPEPIAHAVTLRFGITTVASTGLVSQELTADGKGHTRRLVTDGTFIKNERFDFTVAGIKIFSYIISTDLGNTIDPTEFIPIEPGTAPLKPKKK